MLSVRAATNSDRRDVAKVHVLSWQVGYRDLIPDDVHDQLRPEDRASRYNFEQSGEAKQRTFVASEGDDIVGFVTFGASNDVDSNDKGEIFDVYVDPASWGHGVGPALLVHALSHLQELSFTHAILWVLEGNQRAARFYEIDGWSSDGTIREDVMWGINVTGRRFTRSLP